MVTLRQWWADASTDLNEPTLGPIPFPSRRARMSIHPPHGEGVRDENQRAADNAEQTLMALHTACRRMDVLARELDCLWFYEDDAEPSDDDPPSAA